MESLAAETGSVVKAARAARALTDHGPLQQLTVASDRAATILCRVTEEYYLLLLLARDGNFGRGRFELRKAAAVLEKELLLAMLSLKEIRELMDLVDRARALAASRSSGRVSGCGSRAVGPRSPRRSAPAVRGGMRRSPADRAAAPTAAEAPAADENVHVITSPIVGTFYRSPSPEAEAFAEIGQRIAKGKILCIIESMKLMNEIESDVEGEVVAVYPRNGQPVEYGEKLFAIRLAA